MKKLKSYTFKELEEFLCEEGNENKFLIVKNESYDSTAVMHVFMVNFCGDWRSGDGILFYNDGETHSAEDHDEFTLIDVVSF